MEEDVVRTGPLHGLLKGLRGQELTLVFRPTVNMANLGGVLEDEVEPCVWRVAVSGWTKGEDRQPPADFYIHEGDIAIVVTPRTRPIVRPVTLQ